MRTIRRPLAAFLATALVALLADTALASTASASPTWKLGGGALMGEETILGGSSNSAMTFPGLTTKCEGFLYIMKIKNTAGTGKGEITYLPIFKCSTNSPSCTVETVEAQGLPWPSHTVTVSTANYVVIENVEGDIEYGGEECVLSGFQIPITGTAGGRYENISETIVFSTASFSATGTELRALGSKIEWTGVFSAAAFGPHLGQSLTL